MTCTSASASLVVYCCDCHTGYVATAVKPREDSTRNEKLGVYCRHCFRLSLTTGVELHQARTQMSMFPSNVFETERTKIYGQGVKGMVVSLHLRTLPPCSSLSYCTILPLPAANNRFNCGAGTYRFTLLRSTVPAVVSPLSGAWQVVFTTSSVTGATSTFKLNQIDPKRNVRALSWRARAKGKNGEMSSSGVIVGGVGEWAIENVQGVLGGSLGWGTQKGMATAR